MRKHIAQLVTPLVIQLLCQTLSAAQLDWPQWRGPNRDGLSTETGLLKEWPKDGPPLLWKANGLGVGFSGISVAGQRIFTMGERPSATMFRPRSREWQTSLVDQLRQTGRRAGAVSPALALRPPWTGVWFLPWVNTVR